MEVQGDLVVARRPCASMSISSRTPWPCLTFITSGPFIDVRMPPGEPPDTVTFGLEEALDLLASLEDSRDVLVDTDHFAVLSQVEHQIQRLNHKLGVDEGGPDVR
jgi:hypothetical protein